MKLVILGAGGYGRTVADAAEQLGKYEQILFLDDNSPLAVGKCEDFHRFLQTDVEFIPAFGNNQARLSWVDRLEEAGCRLATIVHPAAYVSPKAAVEPGTVVLPKAVINTGCEIRRGCIINCGAIVDHGCIIEAGSHICLGAIVKAENRIPGFTKIEAGEVVENRTFPL